MLQLPLFPDLPDGPAGVLQSLGEQKDIRYLAARSRSVLNGPETTGMGYWSLNPYVGCAFGCTYCYARYAHRYAVERAWAADRESGASHLGAMPPWLAFERRVFVKRTAAGLLRQALRRGGDRLRPLLSGDQALVIGTATDPYQPAERRYRVTRGVLEVLAEHRGLHIVVITKSPLITRDVDLLARIAERSSLSVHVSLITLNRDLARRLEPRAPTPEARVRSVARLRAAGIEVGINVMPVLPGITDDPGDLEALVRRVAAAGASHVSAGSLVLRHTARERYLPFIAAEFPHLARRYRNAYATGHALKPQYRDGLARYFRALCSRVGIAYGYLDGDERDDEPAATRQAVPVSQPALL